MARSERLPKIDGALGDSMKRLWRKALLGVVAVATALSMLPASAGTCEEGGEDCECVSVIVVHTQKRLMNPVVITHETHCFKVPIPGS